MPYAVWWRVGSLPWNACEVLRLAFFSVLDRFSNGLGCTLCDRFLFPYLPDRSAVRPVILEIVEYLSSSDGWLDRSLNFPYIQVAGTWLIAPPPMLPWGILGKFLSFYSSVVNWFLLGHGLENVLKLLL